MTLPRSQLISPTQTPYYHCIARCVRRSWLCGEDAYTGKNFDHRKPWLLDRLALLAQVFAIHIAGYSIMSNHYHLVLYIDQSMAKALSDADVIDRWHQLFTGPSLVRRYRHGDMLLPAEQQQAQKVVSLWRQRLTSISWFMRCLNEYMARRANQEDGCKGRFWEGRFKSQALLDERALLACLAYVDLNPVRAGITGSLEDSDYTSIQARITQITEPAPEPMPVLMPFAATGRGAGPELPVTLKDYLALVDWTARGVRGHRLQEVPAILQTLGLDDEEWRHLALVLQKKAIRAMNGWDRIVMLRGQQHRDRDASK